MIRIVCDTGPLLHLGEAGVRDLLDIAGDLSIPPAVELELSHLDPTWGIGRPSWVRVAELAPPYDARARMWKRSGLLDAGEAAAIALAWQLQCDWFLTDDAPARLFATSLGLEVHGSLGVVLWAVAVGHLDHKAGEDALDRLAAGSLWVSAAVFEEARSALRQVANE